jgi:hypothetical protein
MKHSQTNLEMKIFGKEINIILQMSNGDDFITNFTEFKKSFEQEGFKNIYIDVVETKDAPKLALCSSDFIDRNIWNYFRVTVMEKDEKKFYKFLEKFSKKRKIIFKNP